MSTMSFTKIEKRGVKEYAYEVTSYWDKNAKISKQKKKYLGMVIDRSKKIFEKKQLFTKPEKLILDFGDTYLLEKFFENNSLISILKTIFYEKQEDLFSLLMYRLCYPSAMKYAQTWYEGNYVRLQYQKAELSSQKISLLFKWLANDVLQRKFFEEYIGKHSGSKEGIIIDTTSLPNQIHIPLTQWGLNGEEIDKQIKFLLVVDKKTSNPLYFKYYQGNIVDVSTLQRTLMELKHFGVEESYVFVDAGFFSEENIQDLYRNKINFLTRFPAERILYKQLINEEAPSLEQRLNVTRYGERMLFIKQKEVELFGHKMFVHIVLDPVRKGRESNRLGLNLLDEKDQNKDFDYDLLNRGIMILISSFQLPKEEVVPAYYVRQTAEKMFGFSKDDLELLPLRVHSEESLKGFLFFQFLSLTLFVQLKNKIGKKYTVEEILFILKNLKCKVYENEIIIGEQTKKQKQIANVFGILVPKSQGI